MRAGGSRRGRRGRDALILAMGLGLTAADAGAQTRPKEGAPTAPAGAPARAPAPASTPPSASAPAPAPASASAPAPTPAEQVPLAQSLTGLAKAEYAAGAVYFGQGDYKAAAERFERAYELSQDHRLLWEVALCHKEQRRYARMLEALDRLQATAGAALPAETQSGIAALRTFAEQLVSLMEIRSSEPGATVLVDGEPVGTTPLPGPVPVDIGERQIRITKPGFKDVARSETVAGGGRFAIAALLEKVVHRGRLRVEARPDAPLIALDGKVVGRGVWEGVVPSGAHGLRVTAPGMLAHQSEVLVQDGEARRIDVTLERQPPNHTATWLSIGGGAALILGAVLVGALMFEPGTPAEQGTLGSIPLSFRDVGGRR